MLSVTSETSTLPAANAPARPARPDQAAGNDFSALIDTATADPRNNEGPVVPSERLTRADAGSTSSDSQPREAPSETPATAGSREDRERTKPAAALGAGGTCKADKPDANRTETRDTSADSIASGDGEASAATTPSQQPAMLIDAAPIAVAIAVPVIATGVVAAALPSANPSEPLAIAAAAIAISKAPLEAAKLSPAAAQAITPSPAPNASEPAPAAVSTGAAPAPAPADLAPIKAAEPVAADAAIAANAAASAAQAISPAAGPDPTPLAAAIPAAAVTPKVAAKTPAAKVVDGAAPSEPASDDDAATLAQPTSADAKSPAAQAPAVDGNQKPGGNPVEAAKSELPKTDAPATPHGRHPAVQLQAESIDTGQPTGAVQQPAPSPAASAPAPQLSVTASNSIAVPLNGLALQIAVTAQSGRSRFEIRLDPAELGRIDVRIDVDRHGQMTSHLTVEKPETLAMLRQDAPQLQRALDNAGFKTGDNGLQFSLRDQSSSGQNGGDQASRNAQRLIISEDDGVAAAMAGRSYGRLSGSGGGVDIRV